MDFFGGDGQLEYTHPHGIGHGVGGSGGVVSQFANTLSFVRRARLPPERISTVFSSGMSAAVGSL